MSNYEEYRYNEDCSELENIGTALYGIAKELRNLGFGDACGSPQIGAIEGMTMKFESAFNRIADAMMIANHIATDDEE